MLVYGSLSVRASPGVGLMAWLNIIGILIIFFMANPALKALRDYEAQRRRGVEKYSFDPEALGIPHADYWVARLRSETGAAGARATIDDQQ